MRIVVHLLTAEGSQGPNLLAVYISLGLVRKIVPLATFINSLQLHRSPAMLFCCRRIGNCVSTFSGFVSRSREIWKKSVEFWVR